MSDAVDRAKSTEWHDSPPDLLERCAAALPGDLLVTRKPGKMGERPYLLTKLPIKMSTNERQRRPVPCEAIALVLGRHQEEWYRDYLLVLCDDYIGWIAPDHIDRFLTPAEAVQTAGLPE